jgi:Domain of unknown function (DUF4272)
MRLFWMITLAILALTPAWGQDAALARKARSEVILTQADVPRLAARLRPQGEYLDAADLVYRQHWAVVDAQINGSHASTGLDDGVVSERHCALNGLIGYLGADWDDVSTDM